MVGEGEGQGSLVCCSPWGHTESDTTERLNNSKIINHRHYAVHCIRMAYLLYNWKFVPDDALHPFSTCHQPPSLPRPPPAFATTNLLSVSKSLRFLLLFFWGFFFFNFSYKIDHMLIVFFCLTYVI